MSNCAVYGCNNSHRNKKGKDIRFFSFPKDEFRQAWINACKRADPINADNARICSIHFREDDLEKPLMHIMLGYSPKRCRKLKPGAVPTENLPLMNLSSEIGKSKILRDKRASKRENRALVTNLCLASMDSPLDSLTTSLCTPHDTLSEHDMEIDGTPLDNVNDVKEMTPHHIHNTFDALLENERLQKELAEANAKISSLHEQMKLLQEEVAYYKNIVLSRSSENSESMLRSKVHELLNGVFTVGQIDLLLSKNKRVKQWSKEDLASAISLRSISPQAYKYLREKLHHPYPGLSTLRTYAAKFQVKQGLQEDVLLLMKSKGLSMVPFERITALSLDEMYISSIISFDKGEERVIGPHRRVQVVMARGLTSNWKQVVFYDFDFNMTMVALLQIISHLHSCKYDVVSLTSDMGSTNIALWNQLKVSHNNCSFSHPATNEPIFVFADQPHELKAARNHYVDAGFVFNDVYIGRGILDALVSLDNSDPKVAYKISKTHLNVTSTQRQKVKLAAQLFSNNTAAAVEYCGRYQLLDYPNWQQTAETIRLFNDWFDVHNSSVPFDKYEGRSGYGTNLDKQNEILDRMDAFISNMRVHKKKSLLPFQKGILLSNKSLRNLYQHLKEKYDLKYLLTRRLNQDILENFFSTIRGMGGFNEHPSPLSFKHRLRWYILGKHSDIILSESKNTQGDNATDLVSLEDDSVLMSSDVIRRSETMPNDLEDDDDKEDDIITLESPEGEAIDVQVCEEEFNLLKDLELQFAAENYSGDRMEEEALRNIAGYVAYRFSKDFPHLSNGFVSADEKNTSENPDWLAFISRGHLTRPSDALMNIAKVTEMEFREYHGSGLSHKCGVIRELVEKVKEKIPSRIVSDDVLHCLIRTRTYIRIRVMNRDLQEKLAKKKDAQKKRKFQS